MREEYFMSVLGPIFKMVNSLLSEKPALKEGYSEEWYFSPEGKNAYESLSTPCEKTKFFLNYLRSIEQKTNASSSVDLLYKIAFVMSSSMVDSQLAFGGYPNILNPEKNPFVYYVKHNTLNYRVVEYNTIFPVFLLQLLHEGFQESENDHTTSFGILTFCKENEPISDMYKIERDIIVVCGFSWWYSEYNKEIPSAYSSVYKSIIKNNSDTKLDESPCHADKEF